MLSYFLACFEVVWCSDVVARETFSPSTQNVFGGHFALQSLCLLWHFAFPQRSVNVWFHTLLAIRSGQGLSWLLCDTIDIEVSQTSSASLPRGLQFMADLWLAQFRQKLHLQTTFPLNLCSRGAMFCHLHPALELESRLRRLPQPRQTLEERWNRHIGESKVYTKLTTLHSHDLSHTRTLDTKDTNPGEQIYQTREWEFKSTDMVSAKIYRATAQLISYCSAFWCCLVIWFYSNFSTNISSKLHAWNPDLYVDIPEEVLIASLWRAWREFSEVQVADASVGSFKAAAATETAIAGNPIQDFLRLLQTSSNPARNSFYFRLALVYCCTSFVLRLI